MPKNRLESSICSGDPRQDRDGSHQPASLPPGLRTCTSTNHPRFALRTPQPVAAARAEPRFCACTTPKGDVNTLRGQIKPAHPREHRYPHPGAPPFPGPLRHPRTHLSRPSLWVPTGPRAPPRPQPGWSKPRPGAWVKTQPAPSPAPPRGTSRGSGCPCAGGGPASSAGWKSCWPRGCALPSRRGCAPPPPPLAAP